MTYQEITALLTSPPADARGLTRWWWYGCAVTREEIVRELDFMQAAHIGGVEAGPSTPRLTSIIPCLGGHNIAIWPIIFTAPVPFYAKGIRQHV